MSWNVAWDFVSEILRDPSSHLVSALEGDRYVPHPAERAAWAIHEQNVNMQRQHGAGVKRITRPWAGKKPTYTSIDADAPVTEGRKARRDKLAALF